MWSWLRGKLPIVKRRRVAVVGIYGSGKTVFLTSLINHLAHHSPEMFSLDGGGRGAIKRFRELPGENGHSGFPFKAYRQHLIDEGAWPAKTFDVAHFRCRFKRTDTEERFEIDLIDFPGERIADGGIFRAANFGAWSDAMFDHWASADRTYRDQVADYRALMEQRDATEAEVIAAYKLAACRLLLAYKPLIAPAAYLLGLKEAAGQAARPTAEQLAATPTAFLGIDVEGEFAPLSAAARRRSPELAARFTERFDRYKAEQVKPLMDELVQVDRLVVLVDIPMILNAGPGLLNDCHAILGELFGAIKPGGWLKRLFGLAQRAPRRIAFVANKADLVIDEDRDNLKLLLREMCQSYENAVDDARFDYFCTSPVRSTRDSERNPEAEAAWLIGRPLRAESGQAVADGDHEFRVSRVPVRWPADWEVGQYRFPAVYPKVPKAVFQPPAQLNLPQLFNFIVS